MKTFNNTSDINFNTIPVDDFWNSVDEKEDGIHKIHSYPAKFPAFITTKAIQFAKQKKLFPKKIADIFCGCGTVALEAKREGIDFWGCDINPVATLIAEVKSTQYNSFLIRRYYEDILCSIAKNKIGIDYESANKRIKYWFDEYTYNDLLKLKAAILQKKYKNKFYRDFFLCAFSNILKPTSRWLTKSIKPQIDPSKKTKDVKKTFEHQVCFMIDALSRNRVTQFSKSTIKTNSILNPKLKLPKVDMIITSPPYVTSYEYADLHQLSSLWLDYTNDFTQLRKGTIGSIYHLDDFDIDTHTNINLTGQKIIDELQKQDKRKAKSVTRYFDDIQRVVKRSLDMLNNAGMAVFIIGNTEYKNVKIDNVGHLHNSMQEVGFSKFYVAKRKITNKILTPFRDIDGKFTNNKESRQIYAEEFILIGEK